MRRLRRAGAAPGRRGPGASGNGGPARHRTSAYDAIKDAILTGVLQPMERISEGQVATRLGLSRTPVREAFGVLAAEGLIVVVPQRGSFVSQLGVDHILEIYQIRTPLECMAARIAAETIGDADLAELDRLVGEEGRRDGGRSARESLGLAGRFHEIIVRCTRNRRLEALIRDLQGQVHRARMLWPSTLDRLKETWGEHAALLAALKARDPDRAERLMREHLERARASTVSRILPITR